jgi:hypothetical protein
MGRVKVAAVFADVIPLLITPVAAAMDDGAIVDKIIANFEDRAEPRRSHRVRRELVPNL